MMTTSKTALTSDLDRYEHIHDWVMTRWFSELRADYLNQVCERFGIERAEWNPVSLQLDYFSDCTGDTPIDCELAISEVGPWSLSLGFRARQHQLVATVGTCELELLDAESRRPVRITAAMKTALESEVLSFFRKREGRGDINAR